MDSMNHEIHEYRSGFVRKPVHSIREVPLTIMLNGREVVTLMCTAKHPEYLAIGFLKSDAFLSAPDQITDISVREEGNRLVAEVETCHDPWKGRIMERSITSGCGKGTNFGRNVATISKRRLTGDIKVAPEQVLALARQLHERSTLYSATRGCHNSALCTPEEILLFREDIGRHNAIDMICGQCFLDDVSVDDKMIVTTGRVASEILLKVVRIGIPVLCSTAVATSFSVELARKTGITLIGNTRDDRFWVYNDAGRITGF
ncbi:MAG: formate dehydrogenase accessory sulfurtransferase FdhD [Desulfovibrionaceae bacterium]|nr:formate dehydrogenase accessory sulfurtransferase FdhD [Desulfovibrionaceae bacterium]